MTGGWRRRVERMQLPELEGHPLACEGGRKKRVVSPPLELNQSKGALRESLVETGGSQEGELVPLPVGRQLS